MFIFSDRIVLITGASRGIGRAAAVKFAAAGAAGVVINYQRDGEAAAAVAEAVERAGSQPLIVRADISRADETATLVEAALQRFGRLDVMVANAGIWPPQERAITDLDEDQWERTMRINVDGIYHVSRAVARIFVAQRGGNIVTVSSTAGQRGEAGHADYAASKGAVISFTKSLAA
ncbi:MAG: SDR family NAD(P)-dependent oxidoreductase, partial [Blastocatellia bacterium]|nr:SDR family NAD(P)-dependent oxidoreductase [Blastocatellia bacterium]